jgi:gamma-glutamylcyclotransferase (GGCT)/AIG2-like uncharacterized protein YtfP
MNSNLNTNFIFVYGTLLSNYKNNPFKNHFQENLKFISYAKTPGQLFLVDYYPAWIPESSNNEWVYGEVYEIFYPDKSFTLLDQYESFDPEDSINSEYLRIIQKVILISNETVIDSWIYKYNFSINNLTKISNGNFLNKFPVNNF